MFFAKHQNLEERIVVILAGRPYITTAEIHQILQASIQCSAQAVFKALRRLQDEQIVLKLKQRYALVSAWAGRMSELSQTIAGSYFRGHVLLPALPEEGRRCTWRFHNLLAMKTVWSEIVLLLIRTQPGVPLLSWNPHPWFYLLQPNHEEQLLRLLHQNRTQMYKIVGSDYFLDREAAKFWKRKCVMFSFAPSPFAAQPETYLSAAGPYIVRIDLTPAMARQIDDIYRKISCWTDIDLPGLLALFNMRTPVSVSLVNNSRQARALHRKFGRFFGIPDLI